MNPVKSVVALFARVKAARAESKRFPLRAALRASVKRAGGELKPRGYGKSVAQADGVRVVYNARTDSVTMWSTNPTVRHASGNVKVSRVGRHFVITQYSRELAPQSEVVRSADTLRAAIEAITFAWCLVRQ